MIAIITYIIKKRAFKSIISEATLRNQEKRKCKYEVNTSKNNKEHEIKMNKQKSNAAKICYFKRVTKLINSRPEIGGNEGRKDKLKFSVMKERMSLKIIQELKEK